MAKQYVITEEEMNGLLDQLKLKEMERANIMRENAPLSPDEQNRLNAVHRSFHMVCVRWAQAIGFDGYRH